MTTWHILAGRVYLHCPCAHHHGCSRMREPGKRLCRHHLDLNAMHAKAYRERMAG